MTHASRATGESSAGREATPKDTAMEAIKLARVGSDKPELYACPKCGALSSPRIYLAREDVAHRAAIEMAESCCAPRFCEDCGGDVPKYWTACAPCRERRMLRKAARVEWDGDCWLCFNDHFVSSVEEFADLEHPPAYCHPCEFEPFKLDVSNMIEGQADQHFDGIYDAIQGPELAAVEAAVKAFNAADITGSWFPDTKRVIVLDEEAFAALVATPTPPPHG